MAINFQRKVVANDARLQANAAGLNIYSITIHAYTITLVILSNIEDAAKHEWGSEFRTAMHTIHRYYVYNAVYDTLSVVTILTELAAADQDHNMRNAPSPVAQPMQSTQTCRTSMH